MGMNTSTPKGRLLFLVTAAFDEFQREPVIENARAGLEAARRRGRYGGRQRTIKDRKRKLAEALREDTLNFSFEGDVIDRLEIRRAAFHRHFPPGHVRELRPGHGQ